MNQRASAKFLNSTPEALRVVVEPWATEFLLPAGSNCEVFSVGGAGEARITVEASDKSVVFWVNTEGAVYEYWQDGEFID